MEHLLIAYNNAPNSELHFFFESCADDAKQFCVDNHHDFEPICPPSLLESNVIPNLNTFSIFSLHLMEIQKVFIMKITRILYPQELLIMILPAKLFMWYRVCAQRNSCQN